MTSILNPPGEDPIKVPRTSIDSLDIADFRHFISCTLPIDHEGDCDGNHEHGRCPQCKGAGVDCSSCNGKGVVSTTPVPMASTRTLDQRVDFMERQLGDAAELEFKFGLLQKEVIELRTQVGAVRHDINHKLPELIEKLHRAIGDAKRYQRSAWVGLVHHALNFVERKRSTKEGE